MMEKFEKGKLKTQLRRFNILNYLQNLSFNFFDAINATRYFVQMCEKNPMGS